MHCFIMKARTLDNQWYPFSISDVPTRFNEEEFALMRQPGSPRLVMNAIRRGDPDTGLYEGDVIEMEGDRWVVCYQRGFYVINELFITRFFGTLTEYKVVGDIYTIPMHITVLLRSKQLFKYKEFIFRLEDIIGGFDESHLILRSSNKPVPFDKISQECGCTWQGQRLFFGDELEDGTVMLFQGRVCLYKDEHYRDITTGGNL